jgi:DnaJ-class molecular chaperone
VFAVTFYEILGVSRNASPTEIKSAFRRLVKRYHPDLTPGVEGVKFRKIVEAFRTVSDPRKRKAYDKRLRQAEEENHWRKGAGSWPPYDNPAR